MPARCTSVETGHGGQPNDSLRTPPIPVVLRECCEVAGAAGEDRVAAANATPASITSTVPVTPSRTPAERR